MTLLAINVGSSSVRVTAFDGAARRDYKLPPATPDALAAIESTPATIVHRIVHGGARLRATTVLDEECLQQLRANIPLAPLHLPRAIAWIEAARLRWPSARAIATFDNAFYAHLPRVAATYALPRELTERYGIMRYGFHGLAHQSMVRQLAGRVISFQLGSGASVTASRNGQPLDTSMGFTPLEGLVMATRAGDLDAGILMHLLRSGVSAAALDHLLEHDAGLRALAGDGDMRALLGRSDGEARLAVDIYVQRARKYLGAYLAVLGGADAIAFGGGVGENAPAIREAILRDFAWAGIVLDPEANLLGVEAGRISAATSRVDVWVTPVDEAAVMRDEAITCSPRQELS